MEKNICNIREEQSEREIANEVKAAYLGLNLNIRILAAEDNVMIQHTLRGILDFKGYFFTIVPNGIEVLKEWYSRPYDLILMDLQMPQMDGWEATVQIRNREQETGGHIPIIALTGCSPENSREKCLRAGMDDFLAKPYGVEELYKAIEQILNC